MNIRRAAEKIQRLVAERNRLIFEGAEQAAVDKLSRRINQGRLVVNRHIQARNKHITWPA